MSLKSCFTELYVNRNVSPEEFKNLPAFGVIASKPTVIEEIEPYGLPEVIKLICCSPDLMRLDSFSKYKFVQPLYQTNKVEPLSIIQEYRKGNLLEWEILRYADLNILSQLDCFFIDIENQRKLLTAECLELQKSVDKKDANEEIQEHNENKLQEKTLELKHIKEFLTVQKNSIEKIRTYKKSLEDGADEKRREEAYRVLDRLDRESEVEIVLGQIVSSGVVGQVQVSQFQNPNFMRSVLCHLSKEDYKRQAINILLKLYHANVTEFNNPMIYDFVSENSEMLLDYLLGMSPTSEKETKDRDLNQLVDLALRLELDSANNLPYARFSTFWNGLTEEYEWTWVLKRIKFACPDDFYIVAGCLLRKLRGKASRAYISVLLTTSAFEKKITASEILSYALSNSDCYVTDSIINTLRFVEKSSRATQIKLNMTERTLRSQSQELFSSLYTPLEQLEELAINLSITPDQVDAQLIGKQLRDQIAELRGALETFGVEPIADIDDWKNLKDVHFNPKHHKFSVESTKDTHRVMYKSLGFAYKDDEGIQKERPAVVFKKITRQGQLMQRQKDTEQQFKDNGPKLKRENKRSGKP